MLPLALLPVLFSPAFTDDLQEPHWICNSSDASISYTYCDHMKFPVSFSLTPCLTMAGTAGKLQISFIPRRDLKKLYFNLYISYKSMELPVRKEVICRGSDEYSFCRALKGETVNTTIPFSFRGIGYSKGSYRCVAEAITGDIEERLFCLNFTILYHPNRIN